MSHSPAKLRLAIATGAAIVVVAAGAVFVASDDGTLRFWAGREVPYVTEMPPRLPVFWHPDIESGFLQALRFRVEQTARVSMGELSGYPETVIVKDRWIYRTGEDHLPSVIAFWATKPYQHTRDDAVLVPGREAVLPPGVYLIAAELDPESSSVEWPEVTLELFVDDVRTVLRWVTPFRVYSTEDN